MIKQQINETYTKDAQGNTVLLSTETVEVEALPNWKQLEQDLRYSPLFEKAFTTASDKGFNMFTATLVNGKRGEASENALAFAFSILGVSWTAEEVTQLNEYLERNDFEIRL